MKNNYAVHRIEAVVSLLSRSGSDTFMAADANNGYWAIRMLPQDVVKTAFLVPNGQVACARFGNIAYGPMPAHGLSEFYHMEIMIGMARPVYPKRKAEENIPPSSHYPNIVAGEP